MKRILPLLLVVALIQLRTVAEEKQGKGDGDGRPLGEFLKQFDKNGDGKLDETEREAAKAAYLARKGEHDGKYREEMLKKFDTNGDGKIDENEKKAAMAKMQEMKEQREKNGGEWPGKEEMLKRFDKNGDGKLDEEEKQAAMAEMKERRAAMQKKDGNEETKHRQGRFKGEGAHDKGAE
jgi:Ca2+-binding EF-hand superfamily protein